MKSLLQEGSSIANAVEKAWQEAGNPSEFTVKILERGESGFFGFFVKKPSVVSILYNPTKISRTTPVSPRSYKHEKEKTEESRVQIRTRKETGQRQPRPSRTEQPRQEQQDAQAWDNTLKMSVSRWTKDICDLMQINVPFNITVNRQVLFVEFSKPVVTETEYQRLFFASLSHILMQFIRKEIGGASRALKIVVKQV